jgi:hypothetical protein
MRKSLKTYVVESKVYILQSPRCEASVQVSDISLLRL